jgi:hypothetical protein
MATKPAQEFVNIIAGVIVVAAVNVVEFVDYCGPEIVGRIAGVQTAPKIFWDVFSCGFEIPDSSGFVFVFPLLQLVGRR